MKRSKAHNDSLLRYKLFIDFGQMNKGDKIVLFSLLKEDETIKNYYEVQINEKHKNN